jgi:capsular exopolysaccharide synthesis family protein
MNKYSDKENQQDEIDLIDLIDIVLSLKKHWKWFILSIFICVLSAFAYINFSTPIYNISSKILIKDEKSNSGLGAAMAAMTSLPNMNMLSDNNPLEDKIEIITSHTIMSDMVRELGLNISYTDKSNFKSEELYINAPFNPLINSHIKLSCNDILSDTISKPLEITIKKSKKDVKTNISLIVDKEKIAVFDIDSFPVLLETTYGDLIFEQTDTLSSSYEYLISVNNIYATAFAYEKMVDVNSLSKNRSSKVIKLAINDNIPERGQNILDKLVELYNKDAIKDKNITFQNTSDFIDERLAIIVEELNDVETSVEQYKKDNNIADIESQAKLLITASGEYELKLMEIETQLNLIQFIEDFLDKEDESALIPANLGIEDEALAEQIIEYNKLIMERHRLLRSTNEQNPIVLQIQEQIAMGSKNIQKSINNIKSGIKIALNDIRNKYYSNESRIKDVPTKEKEFIEIKRQQQIKEALYLFLLQKKEETALSLAITAPVAKTIDKALTAPKPVSPQKKIIILAALLIGIFIPTAAFIIINFFDNKIKNREDLKKILNSNIPIIGEVGLDNKNEKIVVNKSSYTPISEMFRIIRTNLSFSINGKDKKIMQITSTISGEGKTFNAVNLAMSFALTDKKILIVGLDIRNPQLAKYFNLNKSASGITNYLSNTNIEIDNIIQTTSINNNLYIITSGPTPPNPSELLLNQRLDDLFLKLREEFDYIIIDSAPIGVVTDSFLINRVSDITIYVCKQGYTEKAMVRFINETYKDKKLSNIYVLLNGTDGQSSFGYGYGYGIKKNK